jgi:hypothetical protein
VSGAGGDLEANSLSSFPGLVTFTVLVKRPEKLEPDSKLTRKLQATPDRHVDICANHQREMCPLGA